MRAGWIRLLDFARPIVIVLAIVIGCASAGALITSRLYWGYWLVVPSADWAVSRLASTERFTICCAEPLSGRIALRLAAIDEWYGEVGQNLPLALIKRGAEPLTDDAVPSSVVP